MRRLFQFLYQYRALLSFLFLELLCLWLIVSNNPYQGAKFFNSSNRYIGGLLQASNNVGEYFSLKSVNTKLADENAELKKRLSQLNQSLYNLHVREVKDIEIINKYDYLSAKVIKNSVRLSQNYITINKGRADGVEPGMAAIELS